MFFDLKILSNFFAILLFSVVVNCLQSLEPPTKASEISIGLKTLLHDINNPIRLTAMVCWDIGNLLVMLEKSVSNPFLSEFALSFVLAFHATSIGRRQYMLGIVPDDPEYFPYYATEEHQELIVVDLNCKDNLENLLNQVRRRK